MNHMVLKSTQQSVFKVNGFWISNVQVPVRLGFTDDENAALRFPTCDADKWKTVIESLVKCDCEVIQIDLAIENQAAIVPLSGSQV